MWVCCDIGSERGSAAAGTKWHWHACSEGKTAFLEHCVTPLFDMIENIKNM